MFAVTIDLDAYDNLPPRQLKAMLRALRFADEGGVVHASLTMLAMPGLSRSTAHRYIADLEEREHVGRYERQEGGFLWRIAPPFRSRPQQQPPGPPGGGGEETPIPQAGTVAETPVPQRGTTDSRADPRLELSSGSKEEPSEREQPKVPVRGYLATAEAKLSLSQDEIPSGWEEAAAAERRLAGLGPVNLPCEWRKLVAYSEGQRITIWRWRGWALKARGERAAEVIATAATTAESAMAEANNSSPASTMVDNLPGDERQQRQARDWVRSGFWLRSGAWGPAPDQPGCSLPAGLVAWCLDQRAAA